MFGDKFLNRNKEDNAADETFNLDNALDDIATGAAETAPAQEFVLDEPGADFDLSDFNFDETAPAEFEQNSNAGQTVDENNSDLDDFKDLDLDDFSTDKKMPVLDDAPANIAESSAFKDDSLDGFQLPDLDENESIFSQDSDNLQDEFTGEPVLQDDVNEPVVAESEMVEMVSPEPMDSTGFWNVDEEQPKAAKENDDILDDFNFDQVEAAPVFDEVEPLSESGGNESHSVEINEDISAYPEESYDEISATEDAPGFEDMEKTDEQWEDNSESVAEVIAEPAASDVQITDSGNDLEALEKILQNNLRWYSGSVNEPRFEISTVSQSQDIVGTEECDIIHINVGMDTYGWNVLFENGVLMSLRDLRTYQSKFGQLPDAKGSILYGDLEVTFNQISKIVVYESAQYFSYGYPENNR